MVLFVLEMPLDLIRVWNWAECLTHPQCLHFSALIIWNQKGKWYSAVKDVMVSVTLEKSQWSACHHRQHVCSCASSDWDAIWDKFSRKARHWKAGLHLLHCFCGSCGLVSWAQWRLAGSEFVQCKVSLPVSPHSFPGKHGVWPWGLQGQLCLVSKWELIGECSGKQILSVGSTYTGLLHS